MGKGKAFIRFRPRNVGKAYRFAKGFVKDPWGAAKGAATALYNDGARKWNESSSLLPGWTSGRGRKSGPAPPIRGPSGPGPSKRPRITGNPRRRPYGRTTGRSGRSFARRPFKKRRTGSFQSHGIVQKIERGGRVIAIESVYIGHATIAMDRLWDSITYAIARYFAKRIMMDFDNIDALIPTGDLRFRIGYRLTTLAPIVTANYDTIAGETWKTLAIAIGNLIKTAAAGSAYFELHSFELFSRDSTATPKIVNCIIYCRDLKLVAKCSSGLVLQNSTVANRDVADENNDDDGHVTNNPLIGRQYFMNGIMYPMRFMNNNVDMAAFQANLTEGLIRQEVQRARVGPPANAQSPANWTTQMVNTYIKPPPHQSFTNAYNSNRCRIEPGEIRKSFCSSTHKMSIQRWMHVLMPWLRTGGTEGVYNIKIGKARMYGLERILDDRNSEPEITVGYELNMTISTMCFGYSKKYCDPINNVTLLL